MKIRRKISIIGLKQGETLVEGMAIDDRIAACFGQPRGRRSPITKELSPAPCALPPDNNLASLA